MMDAAKQRRAFQLYGAAPDTIIAGNKGARMDGFFACGPRAYALG